MASRPVYSVSFILAKNVTTDQTYTVPTGFVAVIRQITQYSGSLGLAADSLSVTTQGGVTVYNVSSPISPDGTFWNQQELRVVCEAGNALEAHISSSSGMDVYIGGYLLSTP